MGNAEATPHAAGESVEAIRRGSDELEYPRTGCEDARLPASTNVINTPCEAMFHQALIRARLSFETQSHPAGDRYEADIELTQKPIVIEVTNSPGEKRGAPRRERKTAALEAAGYRVYWFSNHQARTDPDAAVRRVMRENGLVPEAAPTVLIRANRAGHVGALNPNWGGGPPTVACDYCGKPVTARKRDGGKLPRFCDSECYGKWMHEHPETVKSKRLTLDWDEAARLYATGMSCQQVGERMGCSTAAVKTNLRKRGVLRPPGGYRPPGGLFAAGELPGS
jgi:very-short-patch-repair endonuclease